MESPRAACPEIIDERAFTDGDYIGTAGRHRLELEPRWKDLPRATLESLALEAYRSQALSTAQLRRLLRFETRIQMDAFLKQHEIYDYSGALLSPCTRPFRSGRGSRSSARYGLGHRRRPSARTAIRQNTVRGFKPGRTAARTAESLLHRAWLAVAACYCSACRRGGIGCRRSRPTTGPALRSA
jgi:hypothetical protein